MDPNVGNTSIQVGWCWPATYYPIVVLRDNWSASNLITRIGLMLILEITWFRSFYALKDTNRATFNPLDPFPFLVSLFFALLTCYTWPKSRWSYVNGPKLHLYLWKAMYLLRKAFLGGVWVSFFLLLMGLLRYEKAELNFVAQINHKLQLISP